MKTWLADILICPRCRGKEVPLDRCIEDEREEDLLTGEMTCPACGERYPIREGVAVLLPEEKREVFQGGSGYNAPAMLSAYLWSHFGDLFHDPQATTAYAAWTSHLTPSDGGAIDVGCAVGRLTFELTRTHPFAVGIDTSLAFIRKAREILLKKRLDFDLIVEGAVTVPRECDLGKTFDFSRAEVIVADAQALPFRAGAFSTAAAVNILEKVPDPMAHLREVNRILIPSGGKFLFSDPFSWDAAFSPQSLWLGGNPKGPYCLRGIDTLRRIFSGDFGVFTPPLRVAAAGDVTWKIRKTEHLWEHITSQYLVGLRP